MGVLFSFYLSALNNYSRRSTDSIFGLLEEYKEENPYNESIEDYFSGKNTK